MTPKEKALELIDKFDGYIHYAERAVDEIISSREDDGAFNDTMSYIGSEYYTPHPMYLTYWKQVKQELERWQPRHHNPQQYKSKGEGGKGM